MSIKSAVVSIAIISTFAFASATAVAGFVMPAMAAAQVMPFDQAAFDAAQKAEKPILVHITAPWCPDCRAQKEILGRLLAEPKFKDLVTFNIDFDLEKALVRKFDAIKQSTLIVFKGAKEEGRSTGETRPDAIEALLDKAV